MAPATRLNDRAASARASSLWHIDTGWSLFAGPLGHNAMHAHSTAVFLAGLYGNFRLRVGRDPWRTCSAAVIRAGTPYEFDAEESPLGVLYLEPNKGCAETLASLMTDSSERSGALVGIGEVRAFRALYEQCSGTGALREGAEDLLAFATHRARRQIDPRIARVVDELQSRREPQPSAKYIADQLGLSASRFQHLFSAEVGVPFRRYRGWQRLRSAIRVAAAGTSLTDAAYAAGFADQAHFSRAFRATFGAPPSRGL